MAAGWQVLERREGPDGPVLRLRCDDPGPELWVPGRHVLEVFAVGEEWIVFSDHDIPHEELLELSLVSGGDIVEQASLAFPGWASAGIVPERLAPRVFGFDFPAGRRWRLELGRRPALVRPRLGVDRHGRWRARLWLSSARFAAECP
ncbi:hypothetical protein [Roseovarius ramblicola]|uniref:Uncharacterized protein n=1 Tax=Roseovarius ramblicola TaxID=2022336 RepID=A0ABV5I2W0_9RHOB